MGLLFSFWQWYSRVPSDTVDIYLTPSDISSDLSNNALVKSIAEYLKQHPQSRYLKVWSDGLILLTYDRKNETLKVLTMVDDEQSYCKYAVYTKVREYYIYTLMRERATIDTLQQLGCDKEYYTVDCKAGIQ